MAHYRRVDLRPAQEGQAVAAAVVVGLGAAAATWFLARLLLQREPVVRPRLEPGRESALPDSTRERT